jgi:hypothetical protein
MDGGIDTHDDISLILGTGQIPEHGRMTIGA